MTNSWQPIETAPKDGVWIVVASTWNKYVRGAVQWDRYRGAWIDWTDDTTDNGITHWMPFPEPPEIA